MKVLNPIYGDYSGKLGSMVFNQTRSGTVVRSLGVGRKINTTTQMENALYRKTALETWKNLTLAEKQVWATYSSTVYQPLAYKRHGVANGYNCHTGLSYLQGLINRMIVTGDYYNETTSTNYFASVLDPVYSKTPPISPCSYSFPDNNSSEQIIIAPASIDLTDPSYCKFTFNIQSNSGGVLQNMNLVNEYGYKITYLLYSSKPSKNTGLNLFHWFDYHIATFYRQDEIYNANNGDVQSYRAGRVEIIDNLRRKTSLNGNMVWSVIAIDENGQQVGTYPFEMTTEDLEDI